jgi:hypothetical protein
MTVLSEWLRLIDSLPVIPSRPLFEIRGEVSSRGALIATNCWSGVIYSEVTP